MDKLPTTVFLPRTVIVLSIVSLLNDAASEMITPLLPVFLTVTLGAGPAIVGLIEGLAEATSSILKLVSGWLADRGWNAKYLVTAGYGISNSARPLIGLTLGWSWVLLLRVMDRLGKGLRTSPRDALIATSIDINLRGRAFGFHRSMDHTGAMIGPLLAFLLLSLGLEVQQVFLVSVIPGVMVILLLVYGVPPTPTSQLTSPQKLHWRLLDRRLQGLIIASGGLALATVPEVFLILWAQSHGLEIVWIPLIWALASGAKALVAMPAGRLSDHLGRIPIVIIGWGLRISILVILAIVDDGPLLVWFMFLAYAASIAFTEAAERALIGDFSPIDRKATAFGIYHLVCGLMVLPGAVLFGLLWEWLGMTTAFLTAAILTAVSATSLLLVTHGAPQQQEK